MLQRLIHSARANVFESARFYYGVLVVLTSYFLLNRFLQKLSYVYLDDRWTQLKVGEGVLFGLAYVFVLISAWFLRKKIPCYVFWCWGGIVCLFLINEFRFSWSSLNYNIFESFTKSQGFYTAKLTFPFLLWGVWSTLKNKISYELLFINNLMFFLIINSLLIIAGFILNLSVFESYPLSGRWGYSGLLWHGAINSILYGVFLIYLLSSSKKNWLISVLFVFTMSLLGQKSAILYLVLIFFFFGIKKWFFKLITLLTFCISLYFVPKLVAFAVNFSPFWEAVYKSNGAWGVISSTRLNLLNLAYEHFLLEKSIINLLFGGWIRYPDYVEMLFFDITMYYGFIGLVLYFIFFYKVISKWKLSIPLIVACFAGGLYESPMGMIVFLIVLLRKK